MKIKSELKSNMINVIGTIILIFFWFFPPKELQPGALFLLGSAFGAVWIRINQINKPNKQRSY